MEEKDILIYRYYSYNVQWNLSDLYTTMTSSFRTNTKANVSPPILSHNSTLVLRIWFQFLHPGFNHLFVFYQPNLVAANLDFYPHK